MQLNGGSGHKSTKQVPKNVKSLNGDKSEVSSQNSCYNFRKMTSDLQDLKIQTPIIRVYKLQYKNKHNKINANANTNNSDFDYKVEDINEYQYDNIKPKLGVFINNFRYFMDGTEIDLDNNIKIPNSLNFNSDTI